MRTQHRPVATVLTVYGIETHEGQQSVVAILQLQQYLPFTVLKPGEKESRYMYGVWLQQYLPFTVLKPSTVIGMFGEFNGVATVLTVYGIETRRIDFDEKELRLVATVLTVYGIETSSILTLIASLPSSVCCNSTYRLRY